MVEEYLASPVYMNWSLPSSYSHLVESVSYIHYFRIGSVAQSRYTDHVHTSPHRSVINLTSTFISDLSQARAIPLVLSDIPTHSPVAISTN